MLLLKNSIAFCQSSFLLPFQMGVEKIAAAAELNGCSGGFLVFRALFLRPFKERRRKLTFLKSIELVSLISMQIFILGGGGKNKNRKRYYWSKVLSVWSTKYPLRSSSSAFEGRSFVRFIALLKRFCSLCYFTGSEGGKE